MRWTLLPLILLTACDAPGERAAVIPWEVLYPAPQRAIYLGDELKCTDVREGMLRFGRDRAFYLCISLAWSPVRISSEAR